LLFLAWSAAGAYAQSKPAAAPAEPSVPKWQALYAFGDSYTDSGAGYVDGNGPTSVVYLAQSLHIPFTHASDPASAGKSINFAVSGARTGKSDGIRIRPAAASSCGPPDEALMGRGMLTQVEDFARRVDAGKIRFDGARTLFFLAGGLNDRAWPTATTVDNIENQIRRLYAAGGRYFLVALLPTRIPAFSEVGKRLNPALARIPQALGPSLPHARIVTSRWGEYMDQVLQRPADFGITNTTDLCAGRALYSEDSTPCKSPGTYFYYHEMHPSTAVQKIVARELEREVSALSPEHAAP
jgi:phospholipase/lecithinase/hemolysin